MEHYKDQVAVSDELSTTMVRQFAISEELTNKWYNSKDAKAQRVRGDIIKGVFWCRNHGFDTDMDYLTDTQILLDSIKRCGFKYTDAESFE
jgi:hypothetical protein